MVNQPSVIFIVRHGTRLDAVDRTWHLSSDSPHDPPLTYGGWTQSRTLGVRIASLLRTKEQEIADQVLTEQRIPSLPETSPGFVSPHSAPPKKLRVYIHSSPYQRCVQTSIAISSGLVQYRGLTAHGRSPSSHASKSTRDSAVAASSPQSSVSSGSKDSTPWKSVSSTALPNDFSPSAGDVAACPSVKAILRIDACLGEWLSPEYSDMLDEPPSSMTLVATAKTKLTRPAETIDSFSPSITTSRGNLWGSSITSPDANLTRGESDRRPLFANLRSFSHGLPCRDTVSVLGHETVLPVPGRHVSNPHSYTSLGTGQPKGYQPPIPAYAIASDEPIPKGYVDHARDACTIVDLQWDSQRQPLHWGDGGEYGEEWSSLHKRFRKGLNQLIRLYDNPDLRNAQYRSEDGNSELEDPDPDADVAIIVVTHSAGCNALIGALTDQPVLLDVGMGSLTMATRRLQENDTHDDNDNAHDSPLLTGPDPVHQGLSSIYEMKLVASVDHLRRTSNSSKPSSPAKPTSHLNSPIDAPASDTCNTGALNLSRSCSSNHVMETDPNLRRSVNTSLDSPRRPSGSLVTSYRDDSSASFSSTNGLWTPSGPVMTYGDVLHSSSIAQSPHHASNLKENSVSSHSKSISSTRVNFATPLTSDSATVFSNGTLKVRALETIRTDVHAQDMSPTTLFTSPLTKAFDAQSLDGVSPPETSPPETSSSMPMSVTNSSAVSTTSSPGMHQSSSATTDPQAIPHRGLQRTLSQKGLWGSAPIGALEQRHLGPQRHPHMR